MLSILPQYVDTTDGSDDGSPVGSELGNELGWNVGLGDGALNEREQSSHLQFYTAIMVI